MQYFWSLSSHPENHNQRFDLFVHAPSSGFIPPNSLTDHIITMFRSSRHIIPFQHRARAGADPLPASQGLNGSYLCVQGRRDEYINNIPLCFRSRSNVL